MRKLIGKKLMLAAALLSVYGVVNADATTTNPNPAPYPAVPNTANTVASSDAIQFAIQAGSIAGAAQACGQDTSVFITRVNEAIAQLSNADTDRVFAGASFQKALQQAQTTETTSHTIPCSQVVTDFNSLPILRDDYKQTVIAQLRPGMANNPPPQPGQPVPVIQPNGIQGSAVPGMPGTTQPVPPSNPYNQNPTALPGAQQQQMITAPSNSNSAIAPAAAVPAVPGATGK